MLKQFTEKDLRGPALFDRRLHLTAVPPLALLINKQAALPPSRRVPLWHWQSAVVKYLLSSWN